MTTVLFDQTSVPRISELTTGQVSAWSMLAAQAFVHNPYFEPQCLLPAANYLRGYENVQLVTAQRDGKFTACLPVITTKRWGPILRPVADNRSIGTAVGFGSPLISSHCPREATTDLLETMHSWCRDGGPGVVVLDWLDDGPHSVAHELRAACEQLGFRFWIARSWERGVLRRSTTGMSLLTTMSKDRRRQVDRRRRRLAEALGGPVELVDRAGQATVLDEFLRLEASGWKGRQGGAYAMRPDAEQWFRELCANFAADNRMHIFCLEIERRVVAILCCIRSGTEAFFFRIGHDASLHAYGLGVLVQAAAVDHLEALGVDFVDSGGDPGNAFLMDLYPDRRQLATMIIATGGALDRAMVGAAPTLHAGGRALLQSRRFLSGLRH